MKIRGAKNNSETQQSQGVNPGKEAAVDVGGKNTNLRQEFQGLLATFAGRLGNSNSNISLETFQVDPVEATAPESDAPVTNEQEPTSVQTAVQASALVSVNPDHQKNTPPKHDEKRENKDVVSAECAEVAASCDSPTHKAPNAPKSENAAAPKEIETAPEEIAAAPSVPNTSTTVESVDTAAPSTTGATTNSVQVLEQATGEEYAQSQDQAPIPQAPIGQEVAASAPADAPEEVQAAAPQAAATQSVESAQSSEAAHPVTPAATKPVNQPQQVQPNAEVKPSAKVESGPVAPVAVEAAPVSGKEPFGQNVKDQAHELLTKMLESFVPAELAPKNVEQGNPAIPVLSQLLRQSMASEIINSSQKANEALSRSAAVDRAMSPQHSQNSALSGIGAASAGRTDLSETRSPRPLPAAAASRVMERVEQTLKESARAKNGKTISLELKPNDLGTVKVDVTLKQGSLHARLGAESAQISQLLRERAPELQAMLRKLGLNVDKVTVSVHADTQNFSQMHDQLERHSSQKSNQGGGNGLDSSFAGPELPMGAVSQEQTAKLDHWVA